MIPVEFVFSAILLYLGLLFSVAYFADRRRASGRSVIANSYVYSLSLAVFYTSWTFYGLVGQAATTGIGCLAPYLGATLVAFTWWFFLRKMVRICKEQNILSIADFISSRYGKSPHLGGIVTIFAVVAIIPYIAQQLKAVAYTFDLLTTPSGAAKAAGSLSPTVHFSIDTAFFVALFLGLFGVLFGARRLDASERFEGLIAAVALQSVVKLVAFVSAGVFITYGLFDGFIDIFSRFTAQFPERTTLFVLGTPQTPYSSWFSWLFFSMAALMFLPRQFHIMVIENSDENHLQDAMWRFPAYAFLLTVFVMPIALGGLILNGGDTATADYFVLDLPLRYDHPWLALLVFLGGLSASAGMVMVESTVLSTMILNHLVMPVILKFKTEASDLSGYLINVKRACIFGVVFLGYYYYHFIGESYTLINIGVVSLIAATQFAPAIIGGLYWKRATRLGATAGLMMGFALWFYTLLIPLLVNSGWMGEKILENGPFGIAFLRPLELFGLSGLDMLSHALFWTMFFNLGAFVFCSLLAAPDKGETEQALKFVHAFSPAKEPFQRKRMTRAPAVVEFAELMTKFIGEKQSHAAIAQYLENKQIDEKGTLSEYELPNLKRFTERVLAGAVGAAAARIIIDGYLAAKGSELEDVFDIFGTVTLTRSASREQLSVLHEAARIVASEVDLQTILDKLLEHLVQQFKFDICVIRTLDQERKRLTVLSHKGMSFRLLRESDLKINLETFAGTAFLTNSETVVNDTSVLDKPASYLIIDQEQIKSFAHFPIKIEGAPVGILSVYSKTRKGIFTDEVIELFKNLAGLTGIALRNALQTEKLIKAKEHEKELQIARVIQQGLLPATPPEVRGISLAGVCIPAREVGGDYYDFISDRPTSLDMVIADVSGHNVGAAMIMAEARPLIRTEAKRLRAPGEILQTLNEFLYEDLTRTELFITMFYLSYDAGTRKLSFANAGHNPPLIWSPDSQSCELLDAEGLVLGVKRNIVFEKKQVQLYPGDILLLYTDGITEATNPENEMFGEDRLCSLLQTCHTLTPQQIIDNLLEQVREFSGNQPQTDDISLAVMKVET